MLEFTLTTVPMIFVLISVLWMCIGMWEYHTVTEAVNWTARSSAVHGAGCAGQTCATTVDTVARLLASRALGIPASMLNVTLTSSASTVTCNPLTNCYGNSAYWPSLAGNTAGSTDITIAATFVFASPISLWSPAHGDQSFSAVTLGANSRQAVVF
jgi:hypothetical protein